MYSQYFIFNLAVATVDDCLNDVDKAKASRLEIVVKLTTQHVRTIRELCLYNGNSH